MSAEKQNDLLNCLVNAILEVQKTEENEEAATENQAKFDEALLGAETADLGNVKKNKTSTPPATRGAAIAEFSDDDDSNYSEYGKAVKHLLASSESSSSSSYLDKASVSTWQQPTSSTLKQIDVKAKQINSNNDEFVTVDSIFNLNIVKPLISSTFLQQIVQGKEVIHFAKLKQHLQTKNFLSDWTIAGVVVNKFSKTSQKGNRFTVWTITDLQSEMMTVCVFLFGDAHTEFGKVSAGMAVGVLNPSIMEKKAESTEEVICLIFGAKTR